MKKLIVLIAILCLAIAQATTVSHGSLGTKGRLIVGDYSAALYESSTSAEAQSAVDAWDSAAWFLWCDCQSPIIADHCTHGFDVLLGCEPDDVCCIVDSSGVQYYVCILVDHEAVNDRYDMYLSSGYNFMKNNDPGYLFMYTCNDVGNPTSITVAVWIPAEDYFTQGPGGMLGFFPPSRPLDGSTPSP